MSEKDESKEKEEKKEPEKKSPLDIKNLIEPRKIQASEDPLYRWRNIKPKE